MAQPVKRPTLDLGSGHNLAVRELEPLICASALTVRSLLETLSLLLSAPPLLVLALNT